jgi:5-methylthioadenosine/S-adenosylhomocysteine deaminase
LTPSLAPMQKSAYASSFPSRCASPGHCPFLPPDAPEAALAGIRGAPKDAREEIAFVERQIKRLTPLPPRLTRGLSPPGPQRSSRALLNGVSDLAQRFGLPIFAHVYETKAQTAKARAIYGEHARGDVGWR